MIPRSRHEGRLRGLLRQFSVVGVVGPRQVGKTTLARTLSAQVEGPVTFFDLEDPTDATRFEDPKLALEHLEAFASSPPTGKTATTGQPTAAAESTC